jgi:hypothetical protein
MLSYFPRSQIDVGIGEYDLIAVFTGMVKQVFYQVCS